MRRIAMLMALSLALTALGSVAPYASFWGHAALACPDGGDGGDGGGQGGTDDGQ
jgi:hypothetical protein